MKASCGFTLIELLVVITIIVVLLALLTPALDKAIYQAELAVDAANMNAIGGGVTVYAAGNQRRYPYRKGVQTVDAWRGSLLAIRPPEIDERPLLADFISMDTMVCPLGGQIDLDGQDPQTWYHAGPQLWYGWRYKVGGQSYAGMYKLGDRFAAPLGDRFNVLASDWTTTSVSATFTYGAHPDHDGKMTLTAPNEEHADLIGQAIGTKVTFSLWTLFGDFTRGPIDRNVLYADGSVQRLNEVIIHQDGRPDERMIEVPEYNNDQEPEWHAYLPKR